MDEIFLEAVEAQSQGRFDEAEAGYRQFLSAKENNAEAWNNLGNVLKGMARLDEAIACFKRAVAIEPNRARAHSDYLSTLYVHPGYDAQAILREHRKWGQEQTRGIEPMEATGNDRSPDRRIRVGYISPHFSGHAAALFLLPLLTEHNHRELEVFCYSDVAKPDALTARAQEQADVWREIAGLSDEQVAQLIRQDGIDVLVDLTAHMAGNRLLVFAWRPAPVQISWLGYPSTTGLAAMDYRLTDPYLDPPGTDSQYVEESIRLPETYWCYHPLTDRPDVGELPALANGFVTFGCLNNFCKINEGTLLRWAKVLGAVAESRLILMAPEGSARQWVVKVLSGSPEGIDGGRIEFVTYQPRPQYLETYNRIDIGLDGLPYNGHTTTLDALWMGVPVVTQVGETVVGRGGWSQCCSLQMEDLSGWTTDQFVKIAVGLAGDLERLKTMRMRLRGQMLRSPLMNARRFARAMEATYRTLWRRYTVQGR